MSLEQIRAASDEEFQSALAKHVSKGFIITHRSEKLATLQKPRKMHPLSWLLILIPGLGWLILTIIFLVTKAKTDVVEISMAT